LSFNMNLEKVKLFLEKMMPTIQDYELKDPGSQRGQAVKYRNTSGSTIPQGVLTLIDDTWAFPVVDVLDGAEEMFVFKGRVKTTKKTAGEAWVGGTRLYLIIATTTLTILPNAGANPLVGIAYQEAALADTTGLFLLDGRTYRPEA